MREFLDSFVAFVTSLEGGRAVTSFWMTSSWRHFFFLLFFFYVGALESFRGFVQADEVDDGLDVFVAVAGFV